MATKTLETLDIRVGTAEQLATLTPNPDAIEFQTDGTLTPDTLAPVPTVAGSYVITATVADDGTVTMAWIKQ